MCPLFSRSHHEAIPTRSYVCPILTPRDPIVLHGGNSNPLHAYSNPRSSRSCLGVVPTWRQSQQQKRKRQLLTASQALVILLLFTVATAAHPLAPNTIDSATNRRAHASTTSGTDFFALPKPAPASAVSNPSCLPLRRVSSIGSPHSMVAACFPTCSREIA